MKSASCSSSSPECTKTVSTARNATEHLQHASYCSYRSPVDADGPLEASLGDPAGERVEERRLAGAAGPKDGCDLAAERLAGDVVEQVHLLLDLHPVLLLLLDDAIGQLFELQPLPGEVDHLHPRDRDRPYGNVAAAAAVVVLVLVLRPPARVPRCVEEALEALLPLRLPRGHLCRSCSSPTFTRAFRGVVVVVVGGTRLGPIHAVPGWPLRAVPASRHLRRSSVASVGMSPAGPPSARRQVHLVLLLLLAMHACGTCCTCSSATILWSYSCVIVYILYWCATLVSLGTGFLSLLCAVWSQLNTAKSGVFCLASQHWR
jgi:hypothetical protein